MSVIYILSDKGKLSKRDEVLIYTHYDGTSMTIFPYKTELLMLAGSVSITGEAFNILAKHQIPTVFTSRNGRYNGKLVFGENKNVFLRQQQYNILSTPAESLKIARSIVLGKVKNEICFMQRIKRKNKFSSDAADPVESTIGKIKKLLSDMEQAGDIDQLRGYEGTAARLYYSIFSLNLLPDWAEFRTRSKNPPESNVNAVLSFLYTLLMYRVESAIESQGLDICCGNLHALTYGKSALVFDLMEEFRTPVADIVCCSLFNLGILKPDDFRQSDDEHGVFLTKEGLKKTIKAFEDKMNSQVLYQPENERLSYMEIIFAQAAHYKRVMAGEDAIYEPYYFK